MSTDSTCLVVEEAAAVVGIDCVMAASSDYTFLFFARMLSETAFLSLISFLIMPQQPRKIQAVPKSKSRQPTK